MADLQVLLTMTGNKYQHCHKPT